jgi:hypothetical protein
MLRDKSKSLKLKNIVVFLFVSYFKAVRIANALSTHSTCVFAGDALSAGAESIKLPTLPAESMILSALFGCIITLC